MTIEISKLAALAAKHYAAQGQKHVDVPEWVGDDGQPVRIYFRPLTLAERAAIRQAMDPAADPTSEEVIRTIVAKATDEAGGKLFNRGDVPTLRRQVDANILSRIFLAMIAAPPTVEDMEKN
jgi:hypothetical protein